MQTCNSDTPQAFPRLATYLEYDPPAPFGVRVPETIVVQEASPPQPSDCDATSPTSFDAILDAYARDPERWDGLE